MATSRGEALDRPDPRLVVRVIRTKHYILFKYGCNTIRGAALPAHVTAPLRDFGGALLIR